MKYPSVQKMILLSAMLLFVWQGTSVAVVLVSTGYLGGEQVVEAGYFSPESIAARQEARAEKKAARQEARAEKKAARQEARAGKKAAQTVKNMEQTKNAILAASKNSSLLVVPTQSQWKSMSVSERKTWNSKYHALTPEQQAGVNITYQIKYHGGTAADYMQTNTNGSTVVTIPPCKNGYPGYNGKFTVVPPSTPPSDPGPDPTPSNPDLMVLDAYFLDKNGDKITDADMNSLAVGMAVTPVIRFYNNGQTATNRPGMFFTDATYGKNGGFSIRMTDSQSTSPTFVYNTPFLKGYGTRVLTLPKIAISKAGAWKVDFYLDPPGTCAGTQGCIVEQNESSNNTYSLNYTVYRPSVTLGSFYEKIVSNFLFPTTKVLLSNYSPQRDVKLPDTISGGKWALDWKLSGIDTQSCVGTHVANGTKSHSDFSGKPDTASWSSFLYQFKLGTTFVDTNIIVPTTAGAYGDFTLTCTGLDGQTYASTHRLFYGSATKLSPLVTLEAALNGTGGFSINDRVGTQSINNTDQVQLRFVSQNTDTCSISDPPGGTYSSNPTEVKEPNTGSRWTYTVTCTGPAGSATDTLDVEVAVPPTPPTGPTLTPSPATPNISVSTSLIRSGDSVVVTWDPLGNTGCSLSGGTLAQEDASVPGNTTLNLTAQTTFTIDCAGISSSKVVKVLPVLYES